TGLAAALRVSGLTEDDGLAGRARIAAVLDDRGPPVDLVEHRRVEHVVEARAQRGERATAGGGGGKMGWGGEHGGAPPGREKVVIKRDDLTGLGPKRARRRRELRAGAHRIEQGARGDRIARELLRGDLEREPVEKRKRVDLVSELPERDVVSARM